MVFFFLGVFQKIRKNAPYLGLYSICTG